ncbi:MAG: putative quinol monooxygenase [Geminicoccaceae bacterium]
MRVIAVRFTIKPDSVEAFRAAILIHAHNSLTKEPGCLRFDVCQDPKEPTTFFLYEAYQDEAAIEAHRASAHFAEFGPKVTDMIGERDLLELDVLNP